MIKNEYILTVDIKKKYSSIVPTFVQYDNAVLLFKVFDDGKPFDFTGYTTIKTYHRRKDSVVVEGTATIEIIKGQEYIKYVYKGSEMTKLGFVSTSLSLFSGIRKVSIQPFRVNIVDSLIADVVDSSTEEYSLLQEITAEVWSLVDGAVTATENAINAKDETLTVKMATEAVKEATELVKNETDQTRIDTLKVKTDTVVVKEATDSVKSATDAVRVATEQVRLDTVIAKDASILATTNTNLATANTQLVADNTKYIEDYNVATQYKKNNIVSLNGSSFIAKLDTIGISPPVYPTTSNANWGILAYGTHPKIDKFISTEGQKLFNLTGSYRLSQSRLKVEVGGVSQYSPENFTETSATTFTLSEGVPAGIDVVATYF